MSNACLVVTTEEGGLDRYSQELAKRLPVKRIETRRYLSTREHFRLARLLSSLKSVAHLPNQHFGRFALSLKVPFVITVHDLARFKISFTRETLRERVGLWLDKKGIRKAATILAVSEYTKRDLVSFLRIPPQKVMVIYNGIDHAIFRFRNENPFDFPYVIYVGSERPRKNLDRLLEAFARVRRCFPELKLVKAGTEGRSKEFRARTLRKVAELGLRREVIFLERVSDEELARYYSGALLLAYPSLYEGFGIPLLEAMACGCPVVASNTTSLPEVAGDAAILVNPYQVDEIAEAMRMVIKDEDLRARLIARGLERARAFSWSKTAEETHRVYQKLEAMSSSTTSP
ncbi:glycosyltransferase family 4 protein [Dehalococcoidia bacterium]|nr:glycosyltransferase family 4 protein [Dehalococcoidia bacterium]